MTKESMFDSWKGQGIFLSSKASKMALEHIQLHMQWAPGALSLGVKQLGH
jgi:hypothetical protein